MLLKGYPERNYLLTQDPTTLMPFGLKTILFNGSSYIVQTKCHKMLRFSEVFEQVLKVERFENASFEKQPWRPSLI